jgi:DNA-binding transcriptional LysR family regulator
VAQESRIDSEPAAAQGDTLSDLNVFVQCADAGSFTAAGEKLRLTPSAVSKIVARLERRVGARLFNRTSRAMSLTREGQVFVAGARRVLQVMDDARAELNLLSNEPNGLLRVHAPGALAAWLATVIPPFLEQHPRMTLDLRLGSDRVDPIRGEIDLAIRFGTLEDSSLISRRIGSATTVTCASATYLAARGTPRTPADLMQHNCLSYSVAPAQMGWRFQKGRTSYTVPVRSHFTCNQAAMVRLLVLGDMGIARLPDYMVEADLRSGALVALLREHMPTQPDPLWLLYSSQRHLSLRIRAFADHLQAQLTGGRGPIERRGTTVRRQGSPGGI